jgi:hypothetical protein
LAHVYLLDSAVSLDTLLIIVWERSNLLVKVGLVKDSGEGRLETDLDQVSVGCGFLSSGFVTDVVDDNGVEDEVSVGKVLSSPVVVVDDEDTDVEGVLSDDVAFWGAKKSFSPTDEEEELDGFDVSRRGAGDESVSEGLFKVSRDLVRGMGFASREFVGVVSLANGGSLVFSGEFGTSEAALMVSEREGLRENEVGLCFGSVGEGRSPVNVNFGAGFELCVAVC